MTRPLSSPASSNSFPSPSRGHDENNFHFNPREWPSTAEESTLDRTFAETANKGPVLIQTNPQVLHTTRKPEPRLPGNASHVPSPLPPKAGGCKQQNLQVSPGRVAALSPSRKGIDALNVAGEMRPALLPRNSALERPPPQPMSRERNDRDMPQRATSVTSLPVGRSLTRNSGISTPSLSNRTTPTDSQSLHSGGGMDAAPAWTSSAAKNESGEPDDMEQALFEQRLTEDIYGVAVRKINQNGKSNLRYVKCYYVDASELEVDANGFNSSRSVSSHSRSRFSRFRDRSVERTDGLLKGKKVRIMTWGKKKEVKLPIERFLCVRKGKTTDRTRRNSCPSNRILSLITDDRNCPSLDIEAPTKLDRDKFARAFSRFLGVPLDGDDVGSIRSETEVHSMKDPVVMSPTTKQQVPVSTRQPQKSQNSATDPMSGANSHVTNNSSSRKSFPLPVVTTDRTSRPPQMPQSKVSTSSPTPSSLKKNEIHEAFPDPNMTSLPSTIASKTGPNVISSKEPSTTENQSKMTSPTISVLPKDEDDASAVSSITGVGYDQEIVEELHLALTKLKAELNESRAEAARAVKVAEQAIQSAENSNSKDWNSTVTHKAAEAAAAAQKRSAEALARARMAEERLDQERKKVQLWRKQAESAAEEVGHWQTRAAVAEVKRAAMEDSLESAQRSSGTNMENASSESELDRLRSKLAVESSARRKLLTEVQDLRGHIRVYCRPLHAEGTSVISIPSRDVLVLHRERESLQSGSTITPLSFEFDGIFGADMSQQEVYQEVESVCLSALEGYKGCLMTYGPAGGGKTHTMLGEVFYEADGSVSISNYGIHLRAAMQIFTVIKERQERYQDTVTFSIVEVCNERLADLLAGTEIGEMQGRVETSRKSSRLQNGSSHGASVASMSEQTTKLEIKTNRDGETVVHGLLSVQVKKFEEVLSAWQQALQKRKDRLEENGIGMLDHERGSHLIATFRIQSKNPTTGIVTKGKLQFVDFANSNVVQRQPGSKKLATPESVMDSIGIGSDFKYTDRSIGTLSEVVTARSQFHRHVPYRNATITHLISDSLEADTKVVLVACVSSDLKDMKETMYALKFAQVASKVVIGKATKHSSSYSP